MASERSTSSDRDSLRTESTVEVDILAIPARFLTIAGGNQLTRKFIGKTINFINRQTQKEGSSYHAAFVHHIQTTNTRDATNPGEYSFFYLDTAQKSSGPSTEWTIGRGTPRLSRKDADILIGIGSAKVPARIASIKPHPHSGQLMLTATSNECPLTYVGCGADGTNATLSAGRSIVLRRTRNRIRFGDLELVLDFVLEEADKNQFIMCRDRMISRTHHIDMSPDPRLDIIPCAGQYHVNDYVFHRGLLGAGTYGSVKAGVRVSTGEAIAVKVVPVRQHRSKTTPAMMRNEIDTIRQLAHPNLMTVEEVWPEDFELVDFADVHMIMPLTSHSFENFFFRQRAQSSMIDPRIRVHTRLHLFHGALQGLNYMHSQGVMHRDISLNNLLTTWDEKNRRFKGIVSDFGNATTDPQSNSKQLGPKHTVAPECWANNGVYDRSLDIYALGYCHLTALVEPPDLKPTDRARHGMLMGLLNNQLRNTIESAEHIYIKDMMSFSPDKRPTSAVALGYPVWSLLDVVLPPEDE